MNRFLNRKHDKNSKLGTQKKIPIMESEIYQKNRENIENLTRYQNITNDKLYYKCAEKVLKKKRPNDLLGKILFDMEYTNTKISNKYVETRHTYQNFTEI